MLAIKDTEMPKSCSECPFKANDYVCGLLDCAFSCHYFEERNYNCPLIEIVTCEHCKYRCDDEDLHESHCERYHNVRFPVYNDFWCADGKRKEE